MFQQSIQPFKIILCVLCSSFSRLWNFLYQSYFPCTWYEEYFLFNSLTQSAVKCLHKCNSMCEDDSLILQMNEARYPWNILKENRRDLHSVNSCCELDTENDMYSGYWERFECHEDISGWIFLTLLGSYFLSSFLSSSNNRKKMKEKKKATVWRYLSIFGTDFCFHFTVFHIVKNSDKA